MKTLILVRHSHAENRQNGTADFERPLSTRGVEESVKTAASLLQRGIIPDRIISSTAQRAMTTATLIAEQLKVDNDKMEFSQLLYYSSPKTIMNFVYSLPSEVDTVMVVAHNPGISDLVRSLSGGTTEFMENTMMAIFRYDIGKWYEIDESRPVDKYVIKPSDQIRKSW